MTEYVPDDAEICAQWLSYVTEVSPSGDWDTLPEEDAVMRWNAWLEALKRTERAAALREAAQDANGRWSVKPDPSAWLNARADRIEQGE